MRTLSLTLLVLSLSLLTGCAQAYSDAASGYPGFPALAQGGETSAAAPRAVARAAARDAIDAPAAPEPRSLEPRFAPREITPREPPRRTDFVECWQCRR